MTNSEVAELTKGDRVKDEQGRVYTVTSNAQSAKSATHYQAYAATASGTFVVRVTANGGFERVD